MKGNLKYKDFVFDFESKELSNNFEKIMETRNVFAGLWYLLARASTIRENQIISMIMSELKKGGVEK